jgi:hypothetical protein
LINPNLNTKVSGGRKGINGFPSGHPNLNSSHPGLLKDFPRGILIIEMLPASLRPKEVEDKVVKDVKQLLDIGEASYMVPLDLRGVIQHDKWPRKNDVIGHSPFLPDVIKGLLSPFGKGTFEKTMLRGVRGLLCANLAHGEDPHALQPCANREAPI